MVESAGNVPLDPYTWQFTAATGGTGIGSFYPLPSKPRLDGTGMSTETALGDIDGDGDLDAVVANAGTQPETVWENQYLDGVLTKEQSTATAQPGQEIAYTLTIENVDVD